ncbi:MAG TPA: AraC family transcriptional regulator [Thermoanaerobaculia bacterium]|nr:AraC family transcriptional regulator [Thermoanaerobaculia bacterium]
MSSEFRTNYAATPIAPFSLLELENWLEPFPRHWHDEWGIAVIEAGVNRFWLRGGWYEAPQGSIIVVPPGEIHDGGLGSEPWAERMAYVPAEAMDAIARACNREMQPLVFAQPIIDDAPLAADLRVLHRRLAGAPLSDSVEASELAIRVIGTLLHRHGSLRVEQPRRGEAAAVERARQFMRARRSVRIDLEAIAAAAGLSQYHLIREFNKRVGVTPHAYLTQLRVNLAQQLLRSTDTIADVALASGFADQAHLTRQFRRTLGVTPGAYRKAHATTHKRRAVSVGR